MGERRRPVKKSWKQVHLERSRASHAVEMARQRGEMQRLAGRGLPNMVRQKEALLKKLRKEAEEVEQEIAVMKKAGTWFDGR